MPTVHALTKGASRTRRIMQLIRALHYIRRPLPLCLPRSGVHNVIADELSRVHGVTQLTTECCRNIDPSEVTPVLPAIPA